MDREDEQDVNPFSGRRAKLEAIAMTTTMIMTGTESTPRSNRSTQFSQYIVMETRLL